MDKTAATKTLKQAILTILLVLATPFFFEIPFSQFGDREFWHLFSAFDLFDNIGRILFQVTDGDLIQVSTRALWFSFVFFPQALISSPLNLLQFLAKANIIFITLRLGKVNNIKSGRTIITAAAIVIVLQAVGLFVRATIPDDRQLLALEREIFVEKLEIGMTYDQVIQLRKRVLPSFIVSDERNPNAQIVVGFKPYSTEQHHCIHLYPEVTSYHSRIEMCFDKRNNTLVRIEDRLSNTIGEVD